MTDGMSSRALIGLGSNMGDKCLNLHRSVRALAEADGTRVTALSRLYSSAAWGVTDQDSFVNACVAIETSLSAMDVLRLCQSIENDLGRVREVKWGPRIIDLDVLVFDDVEQGDSTLTLPHPFITERAFVLVPLHDIAPDVVVRGRTVSDWCKAADKSDVVALPEDAQQAWANAVDGSAR
jgi:2-amino-4-hydroxy-6-hydroxymethyldihydropteridine diphosphokinase